MCGQVAGEELVWDCRGPRGLEVPSTALVTPMGQHTAKRSTLLVNAPTAFQDEYEHGYNLQKPYGG